MKKDIFKIYDKARLDLVDANCYFISVKNSSPLGQGGSRFCKALDLVGIKYKKLKVIRENMLKKYPQLKDLFEQDDLNIQVNEVKKKAFCKK